MAELGSSNQDWSQAVQGVAEHRRETFHVERFTVRV